LKPEVVTRESAPKVKEEGKSAAILCPFCEIPHPIEIGKDSACGTTLIVRAVQTKYPTRTVNKHKLICVKCHKGGGEMIRFNNGFVHVHECAPNTKLMAAPPAFSAWAERVYQMPAWMRSRLEKLYGYAKQVKEIDPEGKETGKILGYFFYRGTT
jgi:hypothetical protein